MRLRHVKNIEEKIKEYSDIIIEDANRYLGKWHKFFNNNNPIYLEIGTGKGKFIIENAKRNPNINYIGCEINSSIIYKAAKSLDKKLDNLLFINYDALLLNEVFDKNEIDKIYLNFSDPWPKNRHEKRRLTSTTFIDVYKNILNGDKVIEFKTDNRSLFEYSIMKFNELHLSINELSLDLHNDERFEDIITTEYEDKFLKENKVIYYMKVSLK